MNFQKEIKEAKDLLKKASYTVCTMLCGRILESAIKYLFHRYLETINKRERSYVLKIQQEIAKSRHERSYTDFPLGKMVTLLERANVILKIIPNDNPKQDKRAKINLWDLVDIRNRATHSHETDKEGIGEEHAHIMYGNVLRIVNSPEIKKYMETYKEKGTCPNCRNLYDVDDGFICKSCEKSFYQNCMSDDNESCIECKTKKTPKPKLPKIETGRIESAEVTKDKFRSIPFESHLYERLRNIYTVLYFMNRGYQFADAVKITLTLFSPNVKDYQTISDACARRFAGNVSTFKEWYDSGVILEKLRSKFYLSDHDYRIFKDLLSKSERKPLHRIESQRKSSSRTVLRKRNTYLTKTSLKISQQHVTAGQFDHLGNGIFQYTENPNIRIDANLPSAELNRELESYGFRVNNLSSFYYQLRVRGNLVNR